MKGKSYTEEEKAALRKFGERLRSLRKEENLSQRQLATKLGWSQSLISKYETGTNDPFLEHLRILCEFFKVSVNYLLGFSNEKNIADFKNHPSR